MVATMMNQAARSSGVSALRFTTLEPKPRTMRAQSRQKTAMSASAVATWSPTTKARYGDSGEACSVTSRDQEPPMNAGTMTVWPRLETGKSSVTPWMAPMTIAWRKLIIPVIPARCPARGRRRLRIPRAPPDGRRRRRGAWRMVPTRR